MNTQLKIKKLYIVTIYTGEFWNGDENDFTVAATSTREARKVAILAMEHEGLGKRHQIRKTFVQEKESIYCLQ